MPVHRYSMVSRYTSQQEHVHQARTHTPVTGRVTPSKEFDESRIPVMALLVEGGADVNQAKISRHMVARYVIVHAVMAGAVERVRWLLEQGLDPELWKRSDVRNENGKRGDETRY